MSTTPHDKPPSLDQINLRPSERVAQYLLREFDDPDLKEGTRLPSNRELARRLKVSVPTVQGVLRQLAQEGRIAARRGSGTYLIAQPPRQPESIRISVAAPLDSHALEIQDPWLNSIFGGLMPAVLRSERPITLVGISSDEFGTDISTRRMLDQVPQSDGLILIPYAFMPRERALVVDAFEKAGKPVVHLHAPDMLSVENFTSLDYYGVGYRVGSAFRAAGRRRVVLLMGEFSFSTALRWQHAGLVAGLGREIGSGISLSLPAELKEGDRESAYHAMKELLSQRKTLPDALYATNREEAAGALLALEERKVRIPEEMSVVVGRDLFVGIPAFPGVTHGVHPLRRVGSALLEMVCERIARGNAPLPGRIFPCTFAGGETTTPEENAILFAPEAQGKTAP